jgi:hypothetical protein
MDYWRTGNLDSKQAVIDMSNAGSGYAVDWDSSPSSIRELAYQIDCMVAAEQLGEPRNPWLPRAVDLALGTYDQLFVSNPKQFDQPFFDGIMAEALINYYTLTKDPRIPPVIKNMLDWIWDNAWDQQTHRLSYNPLCVPSYTSDEEINLLVPAYAWFWQLTGGDSGPYGSKYRTEGDDIFAHCLDDDITYMGKEFNQCYKWSFDYIRYRSGVPASTTEPAENDPARRPQITSFMSSAVLVNAGDPVTLSWTSINADAVNIVPTISGVGAQPANGSIMVVPSETTKYLLIATNATGHVITSCPEVRVLASHGSVTNGAFTGWYFDGRNFDNYVLAAIDPQINFDLNGTWFDYPNNSTWWATRSPFSVVWQGYFDFSGSAMTFTAASWGGMRVYVDGVRIIDDWAQHESLSSQVKDVILTEGTHLISVEYNSGSYGLHAAVSWAATVNLSIAPKSNQPGMIELSWQSGAGSQYAVYRTTNLLAGWPAQPLTNIAGDGTMKLFSETMGTLPVAYYRLKAIGN